MPDIIIGIPANDLFSLFSSKEMEDLITAAKKRKRFCSEPLCFHNRKVDEIPLAFCISASVSKVLVSTSFTLKDDVPQSQLRNCLIMLMFNTINVQFGYTTRS